MTPADLIAYAVYRQFVDHGPEWEQDTNSLPLYEYLRRVAHRFRQQGRRIQGYGIVKMPLKKRVKWAVKRKAD